jgi:uncharacterized protein (DUF433 family)
MLAETRYEHIVLDAQGIAMISGSTMKVKELVAERLAWGWSPEELFFNHPDLTLGQIFSALAYYADHEHAIDSSIQADAELVDKMRQSSESSPLVKRLKAQGLG